MHVNAIRPSAPVVVLCNVNLERHSQRLRSPFEDQSNTIQIQVQGRLSVRAYTTGSRVALQTGIAQRYFEVEQVQ